jgi:Domain of unknown function (DUF3303)
VRGRLDEQDIVHGDRELQERECCASLSSISRSRTVSASGTLVCVELGNGKLDRCYQLMEPEDRALLDQWIANWSDIVDFEMHSVISSKEAAEKIGPRL